MAVVEVECYSSWKWFLTTLKDDLNIINTSPFTIMSDKQKGLIKAVMEVWVDSEHRFCVRHLWSNLNQHGWKGETLKNHLWRCARSTTTPQWERSMEKLKIDCPNAHAFLEQLPPNTWCRAFFSDFSMCDILLNNACEVWNKMILDARELCILAMWEQIRSIIMNRFYEKLKEASEKWVGTLCPKIRQKLRKNTDFSATCTTTPAPVQGMGVFEVISNQNSYVVELNMRSCTCRRWQLTGIPCFHVISCLRHERIKPELMVASCYKLDTYVEAYKPTIYPLSDRSEWMKTNGPDIFPPFYEKKVGRPKRSRRKNPEELADGTKLSKHGVKMHCGYCRDRNHTKRNCTKHKEDVARELGVEVEHVETPVQQQVPQTVEEEPDQANVQVEKETPEQANVQVEEENVEAPVQQQRKKRAREGNVAQPTTSKRQRKPSIKVREQQEVDRLYDQMRKKATILDENGDIDDPTILEHIISRRTVQSNDPSQVKSTLVYQLHHNVPTRAAIPQQEGMPESLFVAAYRQQIPGPARTTTTLTAWRATASGQAAAARSRRGRGKGQAAVAARGRGHAAAAGRGRGQAAAAGRGRGRRGGSTPYWLWGEGAPSTSDQVTPNPEEYQSSQMKNSQTAPADWSDEN